MSNPSVLFRSLLIYGICVPLAAFLGYLLASPLDPFTFVVVGMLFMLLTSPLFLKYYHPWLLFSWNMSAVLFFLPGSPQLWMAMTAIALTIAVLQYVLSREHRIVFVPEITWPLIALALVVVVTAYITGGIGLRSFGSDVYGGKRYFLVILSILGFFAIVSRKIPREKAYRYVALFFLGSATMFIGSLGGLLPHQLNFLFWVFPIETTSLGTSILDTLMPRSWGLALLSLGISCAMLARYGLKGILDLHRPYRLFFLVSIIFVGLLGGFRSVLIIYILTFAALFYLEGMLQTRMMPALLLTVVLGGTLLAAFAKEMPLSVQRTLAFLPLQIDPIAKLDAQASSQWRLRMWRNVLPEIPENFWIGKGYLFSANDSFIQQYESITRPEETTKGSEMVGDYHNGPLSIILPFGIWGVLAFLWFLYGFLRVLYKNHKYGAPELRTLNTFLFAYAIARVVFFFTVFGSLYSDLALFTGLIGLSISLNAGVAEPSSETAPQFAFEGEAFEPEPKPVLAS